MTTEQPCRRELQAAGAHPAPCARHCEATAFHIELRRLQSENEQLRAGYDAARLEIESLQAQAQQCGAGAGCCAQAARIAELEAQLEAQLEAVGAGGVGLLLGAAAQAQVDAPDMFWDADDTENFAHEIQDIVDGYCSGEIVTIECAKRMPNFRVLITGEGDSLSYEHIDAASAAQQGGKA